MIYLEEKDLLDLNRDLLSCRKCIQDGYDIVPGAIFSHPKSSKVMLIGQAPGVTEVEAQRPFNAGSGRRLFQWLEEAGWNEEEFRSSNVMTAVTKCYPGKGKNGKGDRVPTKVEQANCRPYLMREFSYYDPELIILVGGLAIKLFYPAKKKLNQIIGSAAFIEGELQKPWLNFDLTGAKHITSADKIGYQKGSWVVPLPHPSGASLWPNKKENRALISRAMKILGKLRQVNGY